MFTRGYISCLFFGIPCDSFGDITRYHKHDLKKSSDMAFAWHPAHSSTMVQRCGTRGATLLVGAASGECELEPALSWAGCGWHRALGGMACYWPKGKWIKRHTIRYTNYISLSPIFVSCSPFEWLDGTILLREHQNKGMPKLFLQAWLISLIFVPQESRKNCGSHPNPRWQNGSVTGTWELQKNDAARTVTCKKGMGRWQIQRRYEGDMICQQQWK